MKNLVLFIAVAALLASCTGVKNLQNTQAVPVPVTSKLVKSLASNVSATGNTSLPWETGGTSTESGSLTELCFVLDKNFILTLDQSEENEGVFSIVDGNVVVNGMSQVALAAGVFGKFADAKAPTNANGDFEVVFFDNTTDDGEEVTLPVHYVDGMLRFRSESTREVEVSIVVPGEPNTYVVTKYVITYKGLDYFLPDDFADYVFYVGKITNSEKEEMPGVTRTTSGS
jgi:hypothetical protein